MNSIEDRLCADAAKITATAPASMLQRVRGVIDEGRRRPVAPSDVASTRRWSGRLVWRPGLPQLGAAAMVLIAVAAIAVWTTQQDRTQEAEQLAANEASLQAYQGTVMRLSRAMEKHPLPAAELDTELERLGADMRRIRSHVRRQMDPLL